MDQDVGKVNSYQHRNIFASNYEETRSHEIIVRNPNNKITLHTKYCFYFKGRSFNKGRNFQNITNYLWFSFQSIFLIEILVVPF